MIAAWRAAAGTLVVAVVLAAVTAAPALAALDATTTSLDCVPASASTATAVSCTAVVTDTAAQPDGAPTGAVAFAASPNGGSFSPAQQCTLKPTSASRASCAATFTASVAGSYTLDADYAGDPGHVASTATTSLTAIDPTTTTLTCTPASLETGDTVSCTATLTDPVSPTLPRGSLTFSAAPTGGAFGTPGECSWRSAGNGGEGACSVSYTPAAEGTYTVTAAYSGDTTHAPSQGSATVTVTGPTFTVPNQPTTTTSLPTQPSGVQHGTLVLARRAPVTAAGRARIALSCAGPPGAQCGGAVTLTARLSAHRKRGRRRHRRKRAHTVTIGRLRYSLVAGSHQEVELRLPRAARRMVARAGRRGLRARAIVTAAGAGTTRTSVRLVLGHHRHRHKRPHRRHRK